MVNDCLRVPAIFVHQSRAKVQKLLIGKMLCRDDVSIRAVTSNPELELYAKMVMPAALFPARLRLARLSNRIRDTRALCVSGIAEPVLMRQLARLVAPQTSKCCFVLKHGARLWPGRMATSIGATCSGTACPSRVKMNLPSFIRRKCCPHDHDSTTFSVEITRQSQYRTSSSSTSLNRVYTARSDSHYPQLFLPVHVSGD